MKIFIYYSAAFALSLALSWGPQQRTGRADTRQGGVPLLVHDPRIVENGPPLAPIPPGVAYSEWTVNGSAYVIFYRNVDKDDPHDIVAEIYLKDAQQPRLKRLISLPVYSQVDNVKLVSMTDDSRSQLAFFRSSGQQDLLTIVSLDGPSASKLFDYGGRWIKLTDDKPPKILVHSHPDDVTETFVWCSLEQKIVLQNKCGQKK